MVILKFYGTSNANPHPDRRQSGLLLTINKHHYLFDCGDGIATALWNDASICLNRLNAVFFSHRHADHIGGIASLVLLLHQRIKKSQNLHPGAEINRMIPIKVNSTPEFAIFVPGHEDDVEFFTELLDRTHMAALECSFSKNIYSFHDQMLVYQDKFIQVSSFPTYHSIDSCGFIIQIEGKKILYSGDIKHPEIVAKVIGKDYYDLVIIENAHFPPKAISDELLKKNIKNIIITHQRDEYLSNREQVLKELESLFNNHNVLFADDDLEFNIES